MSAGAAGSRAADATSSLTQALRFAVVGGVNTAIDLLAFMLLFYLLVVPLLAANALAYVIGTVNGFFLNKHWTFSARHARGRTAPQLLAYLLIYTIGLTLSTAVVWALVPALPALLAKCAAVVVSAAFNFVASRRFIFVGDAAER